MKPAPLVIQSNVDPILYTCEVFSAFALQVDAAGVRTLTLGGNGPGGGLVAAGAVIRDEEVGREGLRLTLEDAYTRGPDGSASDAARRRPQRRLQRPSL